VVVVGAGNIGSFLIAHLGRMAGLGSVTVIDRDVYEAGNLASQDIARRDVGRPKAVVQAHRLRRMHPTLSVTAIVEAVERVPLAFLRGDVLLACLDSKTARRSVNESTWRLGVPWIDAGVRGPELLARVNVYVPGPDQACLECGWSAEHYATLEAEYPCDGGQGGPGRTNSPSGLGALAAALQALECQKLLAGDRAHVAVGSQVTISALAHRHYVTRLTVNPVCRFDHDVWRIEPLERRPEELTVGRVFALGRGATGGVDPLRLHVADQPFTTALVCPSCGRRRGVGLRLCGRIAPAAQRCETCGRPMRASGADMIEWLPEADLPSAIRETSLRELGFHAGDVVTVAGTAGAAHFQIGEAS